MLTQDLKKSPVNLGRFGAAIKNYSTKNILSFYPWEHPQNNNKNSPN